MIMLDFKDYAKYNRLDYVAPHKVEENFYKAQKTLGEPLKGDIIVPITIRLKGIRADWVQANLASNALQLLVSRKFWGKKSKYQLMPYVSSIEVNEKRQKNHIHSIFRITGLKQDYSIEEIEQIIRDIAFDLEETASDNNDAVKIRIFPFCEEHIHNYGNTIEYICKTSSKVYDPLQKKILTTKEKQQLQKPL
jgi:hypothetical protein